VVIDGYDDRVAGLPHRDADPAAERQMVARGGHAILMEDFAAACAMAFMMGAVPCR
jgi:hypothetical protein